MLSDQPRGFGRGAAGVGRGKTAAVEAAPARLPPEPLWLRWMAAVLLLSHAVFTGIAFAGASGPAAWVCVCGCAGALGGIWWVATAKRYDIIAHVVLSPVLGIAHNGLPLLAPVLLLESGLLGLATPSRVPFMIELWHSGRSSSVLAMSTLCHAASIVLVVKQARLRRMLLLLLAVFDIADGPVYMLVYRTMLHGTVLPLRVIATTSAVRVLVSLAAEGLALWWRAAEESQHPAEWSSQVGAASHGRNNTCDCVGPAATCLPEDLKLACCPPTRAGAPATCDRGSLAAICLPGGQRPACCPSTRTDAGVAEADHTKPDALLACAYAATSWPAPSEPCWPRPPPYVSTLLQHSVSVKLHDVGRGMMRGRLPADAIAELERLLEESLPGAPRIKVSLHNAALTSGCLAITCNMELSDENGPLSEDARRRVLASLDLPSLMTAAVTGLPASEGNAACVQDGASEPPRHMRYRRDARGFVSDEAHFTLQPHTSHFSHTSTHDAASSDEGRGPGAHATAPRAEVAPVFTPQTRPQLSVCEATSLMVVPPLGARRLQLRICVSLPAGAPDDNCEVLVAFAPHTARRVAAPLLRVPLSQLRARLQAAQTAQAHTAQAAHAQAAQAAPQAHPASVWPAQACCAPADVLVLELDVGVLPKSGVLNVMLLERGRMLAIDAIPLLPACARGAVRELCGLPIEASTVKSIATDLAALLAPRRLRGGPAGDADSALLLGILEAMSRWVAEAGKLPKTRTLLRVAARTLHARRVKPAAAAVRPSGGQLSGQLSGVGGGGGNAAVMVAWFEAFAYAVLVVRALVASGGPDVRLTGLWMAFALPSLLVLSARAWPALAERSDAALRAHVHPNLAKRTWRVLVSLPLVWGYPGHPLFQHARESLVDLAFWTAVQAMQPMPTLRSSLLMLLATEIPIFAANTHLTTASPLSPLLLLRTLACTAVLVLVNVHCCRRGRIKPKVV